MIQFAERIPNRKIVATLSRQLGWSHFKELLPIDDDLKRDFYTRAFRPGRPRQRRELKGYRAAVEALRDCRLGARCDVVVSISV